MNTQFEEFLKQNEEALAQLLKVVESFRARQLAVPAQQPDASGPDEYHVGKKWSLETKAISDNEINALYDGVATAIVKEKVIAYIKGFVQAVLLVGGAA